MPMSARSNSPVGLQQALRGQISRTVQMFRGHTSTVKGLLASEPLWGTTVGWFNLYTPLYMVAIGVSEVQVGLISSLLLLSQAFGAIVGGHFADVWGRKRTMQTFDAVAWLTSILLWFFARNHWYFIAAALINGLYYGAIPSWNCLLVENTPGPRRASVYAIVELLFLGSGMFGPVGGYLVAQYGIVKGVRSIYALGFALASSALLIRQIFVKEAVTEKEANVSTPGLRESASAFIETLRLLASRRTILLLFLSQTINLFYVTIWNAYSGLYMTKAAGLALPPSIISALPPITSASMALILLLVIPNVTERMQLRMLVVGTSIVACATVLFLLTPPGLFWPLALYSFLAAAGAAIISPLRSGYLANAVPDEVRAKVMSLLSTMTLLATIPAGPVGGLLFRTHAKLPFALILGLQLVHIGIFLVLAKQSRAQVSRPAAGR